MCNISVLFLVVLDGGGYFLYSELKQIRDKTDEENEMKAKKKSIDSLMKYLQQHNVVSFTENNTDV